MDNVVAIAGLVALGAIGVAREMSARRAGARLKRQLADARSKLSERNDMASVGQLVSGLAQELKSPLQGVLGNTELMLASSERDASTADELLQIREDATRAAGIVRSLLAFTETATLSRRWHDINEIVVRAVETSRGELETAGVHVQVSGTARLPLVYVDGRQLEKVITTLLVRQTSTSRAPARAGAASAVVAVATRHGTPADDRLIIELDDRTPACVEDEASWSADLAACRRVLEAHGGTIEVESPGSGGFRFHLELPIIAAGVDTTS